MFGAGGVDTLLQHYRLASAEGQALMRLAEALPRIPDRATARRLMQDLLGREWPSLQNAHLWLRLANDGLALYSRLSSAPQASSAYPPAQTWLGKASQPLADKAVALALKALGQHFVLGETIEQALAASAQRSRQGYLFSYDMLGEAACTLQDALRYSAAYEHAIDQVGKSAAAHRKARSGDHYTLAPSISVKLSALHPRFEALQSERVLTELLPRLITLMRAAARWGIALTIDAEESTRLELTLDLFEALAREPTLANYQGMGLAVQAYNKSAPFVIDWLGALARHTDHRFMVRLVKGAYWDAEIKRAQLDGLAGYPVYTRKAYTDTAYLACARKLIDASGILYPQFATQNAHTLAAVYVLGRHKPYEYQCLYGMGEALYDQLIGQSPGHALNDPIGDDFDEELEHRCRIYAPVGTSSTLLAYLVRRLLENGANNAFAHRIVEPQLKLDALLADPVAQAQTHARQPTAASDLPLPAALYLPQRPNAAGLDLSVEANVEAMADALAESQAQTFVAMPLIDGQALRGAHHTLHNPALGREVVGIVIDTPFSALPDAMAAAQAAAPL
ncbi:MAG TPA: proline dehydrogenase family protein, partial [Burkholderiaceae bacterium]|nr:proline dehydrogenase family protein [Burkholderiaceae bacterium]